MIILHYEKILCASGEMKTLPNNVQVRKAHDSRARDLVGSTNREIRGVAEADTTYVDPFAVGVHNENSDDIWSLCTYSITRGLCYTMHVRRHILLANICNEYARHWQVFSTFEV